MVLLPIFNGFWSYKGHLEFSGAFFPAQIFENFRIFGWDFQLGNRNRWKIFRGLKYAFIYRLNTKIRSTTLCLSGFELYSLWVPPWVVIDCGRATVEFDIFQLNFNSHFAVTRNPIIWRLVGHSHDFLMGASYHVWVYQVIIPIKKTVSLVPVPCI